MEAVLTWAAEVGEGMDDLTPEQRKDVLQIVVEEIVIDRENNADITLTTSVEVRSARAWHKPKVKRSRLNHFLLNIAFGNLKPELERSAER